MRLALAVSLAALAGCAAHRPVVADVRCPRGAIAIYAGDSSGRCIAADGKRQGPSWSASDAGVTVESYDHDVLAGPWERWDARGELVERGYHPGVTDSTEPAPDVSRARWDSPKSDGKLVWPERVRIFPLQTDVAFSASILSTSGKATSAFLGAAADVAFVPPERVRFRGDAYQALYIAYGVQGLAGTIARSECDDPTIAGSGGFCGSRWMVGPFLRVGNFRSADARANGAVPSLLAYGRIALLFGQDRWSSVYSHDSALVWRLRGGAGYTALGAVGDLVRHAESSPAEGWRWLLVPLAVLLEHAEAYVEIGGDGTSALGAGGGVDVGFGL